MEMQDSGGSLSSGLARLTSSKFTERFHFEEGEQWRTAPDVNFQPSHALAHNCTHPKPTHKQTKRETKAEKQGLCFYLETNSGNENGPSEGCPNLPLGVPQAKNR